MRHKLDYARYRIRVRGLEFEVGNKYLLRQFTGFLICQKHRACLPKSPRKVENIDKNFKVKKLKIDLAKECRTKI
jgi:hypothetical protein